MKPRQTMGFSLILFCAFSCRTDTMP
uniref:Uncharacterized protein n=1 Tax=Rhizophora mucronata TaxID=61149 RepID=A0A2P2QBB6_RHIMU